MDPTDIAVNLPQFDMPGGEDFIDVTHVFSQAAHEMSPGEVLLMEGFSLQDAMCAFEIGEPRLDSGMAVQEQKRPPFDPLAPLLPEELCWIIDRSFAYEMLWHAGNTLSQSIFTLLYVHHLGELELDLLPLQTLKLHDQSRPMELITVVLRSYVMGLLKCCDAAWRELSKGAVKDGEDWQSDKCEVSLLEGVPPEHVLAKLDEAKYWLLNSPKASSSWREALLARISLRKTLLHLLGSDVHKECARFQAFIRLARDLLCIIRASPSPQPEPHSLPQLAYDPYISRRLNIFVPTRILDVPPIENTWKSVDLLLDGWYEQSLLTMTHQISTWEIVANLRLWLPQPPLRMPLVRSVIQSTFYNGVLILNNFTPSWIVEQFFFETLGVPYRDIQLTIENCWKGPDPLPFNEIGRRIIKLLVPHIQGLWLNPPRRRRFLIKSLVGWHQLYDILLKFATSLTPRLYSRSVITHLATVALVWRLSTVREVVLSGFQLELYSSEEKPYAYWYTAKVIEKHLDCLDNLSNVVPKESLAFSEMRFQSHFLTAVQLMSIAVLSVSIKLMSFNWQRMKHNFLRRYKWAFCSAYDAIDSDVVVPPEIDSFMPSCSRMMEEPDVSPSELVDQAHRILSDLLNQDVPTGWAGQWGSDRMTLVENLMEACDGLRVLPASTNGIKAFDIGLLKWDPSTHVWFPIVTEEGAETRRNTHVKPIDP